MESQPPGGSAPERVAILGLGLVGASLALALRERHPGLELIGVDADPITVHKAVARGAVSAAGADPALVAGADLVVLAVPIRAMRGVMARVAPFARRATVTDVASTKGRVMEWAAESGLDLVGGHPMAGREAAGIDAATADLFAGATWALTRSDPRVEWMVEAVGARALVIDAESHDRLVAGVSHAAFVLSAAYVLGLARRPDWASMAALAGPGFRDLSRLAEGDPDMYLGVAQTNREGILEALDSVQKEIDRLRRHLQAGDDRLVELFEEARAARERWRKERGNAGDGQAPR